MREIRLRSLIIEDLNDRNEILDELSRLYTDDDFNGENGIDYVSDEAKEAGYESDQEFVIDQLEKTDLEGFALIEAFCESWFSSSSYYSNYDFEGVEHAGATIVTIAFITGD